MTTSSKHLYCEVSVELKSGAKTVLTKDGLFLLREVAPTNGWYWIRYYPHGKYAWFRPKNKKVFLPGQIVTTTFAEDKGFKFQVIEDLGIRVHVRLVTDMPIPPTFVYSPNDLRKTS